jgi:hypothetical protein
VAKPRFWTIFIGAGSIHAVGSPAGRHREKRMSLPKVARRWRINARVCGFAGTDPSGKSAARNVAYRGGPLGPSVPRGPIHVPAKSRLGARAARFRLLVTFKAFGTWVHRACLTLSKFDLDIVSADGRLVERRCFATSPGNPATAVASTSRDLQKVVLRQTVAYAAADSAVGFVLLTAVASPLSNALYGTTVWDRAVAGATALLLAAVSMLAAALLARDAARIARQRRCSDNQGPS